jgi:hypothetical protein
LLRGESRVSFARAMSISWFRGDRQGDLNPAVATAEELREGIVAALESANGSSWYEPENLVDPSVAALCRLRRAAAAAGAHVERGDEAVRAALSEASPETVIWIASRMVSYLDENAFVEVARRST